jgi:hypothetical protein
MLAALMWIIAVLVPKARREQDSFGMVCALLAAVVAIFGCWLFAGRAASP